MLYVRPDRPVDNLTLAVLREADQAANTLGLGYFVAGAMARDILLTNVYGVDVSRATRDVDLALAVESWAQFETIKAHLIGGGNFRAATGAAQRLYYRPESTTGYPLDIIPFRGVELPSRTIAWPPEFDVLMNVVGYEEALATAVQIQVAPDLAVRVASLPGLAILKLFAWEDRGHVNAKDAMDLCTIFRSYGDAGNRDRLYGDMIGVLEAVEYDVDLAGPRLLGKDVRGVADAETMAQLLSLLSDARKTERLVTDMARSMRGDEDGIELVELLLGQFVHGLRDD